MSKKNREVNLESAVESKKVGTTKRFRVGGLELTLRELMRWFRENAEPYQCMNLTKLGVRIKRDLLKAIQLELVIPERETECEYGLAVCGDKLYEHEWWLIKAEPKKIDLDRLRGLGARERLHTHPGQFQKFPSPDDYMCSLCSGHRKSVLSEAYIAFYPTHKHLSEVAAAVEELDVKKLDGFLTRKHLAYLFALSDLEDVSDFKQRYGICFYSL